MHNSKPQKTLYRAEILLNWGGRIDPGVESLMMILFSAYLAYLSTPSSGVITMLL